MVALAALTAFAAVGAVAPAETAFAEAEYVYVGGTPVGITVGAGGLIVTGVTEVDTGNGTVTPLAGTGITKGDVITSVDGVAVVNMYDFTRRIATAAGKVTLTVKSGAVSRDIEVVPVTDAISGEKKLGLMLKEDIGGVGTLTFVTEEGVYAALGHRISDPETGLSDELQQGKIFDVEIENVIKGEKGKAGGLQASINRLQTPAGINALNTDIGIYGVYGKEEKGAKIRVAGQRETEMGRAQVLTTLEGGKPEFYDVDIVKSVPQRNGEQKGLVIVVRDERLLEKAGGIVQGMSGSPIIQNGALVGAVTHVFVSDPTRGYGVHAEFMLNKAEALASKLQTPQPQAAWLVPQYAKEGRKEAA